MEDISLHPLLLALDRMKKLYVELLQMALGTRDGLSRVPSAAEWEWLLEEAEKQAIEGVMFCGLERLQRLEVSDERLANCMPPLELKLQWIGEVQMIEQQNRMMSKACREVAEKLEEDGFWCCVLKGQANLRYYPEEMRMRRSPGDIDVWTVPNVGKSGDLHPVRRTLEYVEKEHGLTGLCWLHCNFNHSEDVPVEVHFRPSFMNEPIYNRRLQRFFKNYEFNEFHELGFSVLPVEVDVVYQMNHIYRHLIDEGVGLRQVVDYYWVLKIFYTDFRDTSFEQEFLRSNGSKRPEVERSQMSHKFSVKKDEVMKTVEWLGMKRFAGALMWVMKEVCGMPREELLCDPDAKEGRFLLNEIMLAGNFGQSDPRMGELNTSSIWKRQLSQAWRRFRRNMRFVTSYPGEVIWEPVARMEHFAWKKLRLWRY